MEGNGGERRRSIGDQVAAGDAAMPHESVASRSSTVPPGPDGQDDQIGGSSWVKSTPSTAPITGQRDAADELHGDGDADVQLGDNGKRAAPHRERQYLTYQRTTGKPTIVRQAASAAVPPTALPARFDVGAVASAQASGATTTMYGDGGDDLPAGRGRQRHPAWRRRRRRHVRRARRRPDVRRGRRGRHARRPRWRRRMRLVSDAGDARSASAAPPKITLHAVCRRTRSTAAST